MAEIKKILRKLPEIKKNLRKLLKITKNLRKKCELQDSQNITGNQENSSKIAKCSYKTLNSHIDEYSSLEKIIKIDMHRGRYFMVEISLQWTCKEVYILPEKKLSKYTRIQVNILQYFVL